MSVRAFLYLALLSAAAASAASSGFMLGVDYSEWATGGQMQTDSSGALYSLAACSDAVLAPYCVTKLSADGTTILWQNNVGSVAAFGMAVDPSGGVYVVPLSQPGDTSIYVAKLSASGTGLAWKSAVGDFLTVAGGGILAADSQGRVYVAGVHDAASGTGGVVRLNAAGTAVDYAAQVTGIPGAISVDGTGAAFVASGNFIARLAPDGSAGFYTTWTPPHIVGEVWVAVDASGNAAVLIANEYVPSVLQRFDSTGATTFSKTFPVGYASGLALDASGNAYVTGFSGSLYPVLNSLATCGSEMLNVFAPDGALLQATYLPGATGGPPFVAAGPNSTVFVVAAADPAFVPTRAGPVGAGAFGAVLLLHLSPNPNAQALLLACVGNAATYETGPIAPGGFVTLFGSGLGPEQGVQTQASLQNPFPTEVASVAVTFDGTPAPLLWVQDSQINLVAPWSLTPGQNTQVCVSYNDVNVNCLTWPVAQTAPSVFTVDGVYAAAVNQDGSINSAGRPAPVGSIVSIWATGLGPIAPPQADGTLVGPTLPINDVLPVGVQAVEPSSCPSAIFGCQPSPPTYTNFGVTYAGPAPYMVAGASQINFRVVNYQGSIFVNLPSTSSQSFQIYVVGQ
jgi:uncharacterized protein (TIGR03437 family)